MATQTTILNAQVRSDLGSRANKRLRDRGLIPAVVYGHKEAVVPLSLERKEISGHLEHGAHIFDLSIDGRSEKVLVKEIQWDHLGKEVIHVDFARVSLDEKVELTVELELRGTPKGASEGGVLQQVVSQLEIECLVTDVPDVIRHNVSEMALNSALHVRELQLPPGVRCLQDEDMIVAMVRVPLERVETPAATDVAGSAEPEIIARKKEEGEDAESEKK